MRRFAKDAVRVPFEMRFLAWTLLGIIGLALAICAGVGGYYEMYRPLVIMPPLKERRALYEKYHAYLTNASSETQDELIANCDRCNDESIRRYGKRAEAFKSLPPTSSGYYDGWPFRW